MINTFTKSFVFISLMLLALSGVAQNKVFTGDPDVAFEMARKMAFNEQREQAKDTLRLILEKYPDYHDVRAFLASIYSWDGNYDQARKEFDYVLKRNQQRKDIWAAAINNELWSESPFKALSMAKSALSFFPNDEELTLLLASAQEKSDKPEDAVDTLKTFLATNSANQKAQDRYSALKLKLKKNSIGIKSAVDLYSETFDPMQYYALSLKRQTTFGSIIARVNFNRRFGENGVQYELDLYPRLGKGFYAYLNGGYANTFLFPDFRFGAELHKSLFKGIELSLGIRTLKYSSTTTIYTGSISWYIGNSYWSFRSYITPGDSGSSKSGILNFRRYGKDANNYLSADVGIGFSPEINRFQFDGNEEAIVNLKSQKLSVGYYFTSSNEHHLLGAKFGVSHQEKSFDIGSYFWIYSLSLDWEFKFGSSK